MSSRTNALLHILLLLSCFVLSRTHAATPTPTSTAASAFVVTPSSATQVKTPVLPSQAYSKQWTISRGVTPIGDAIEALALDLPGQVFVTYVDGYATSKQVASVKVFGATAALVDAVEVATKRAMRGTKLAVSHASASAATPSSATESLLTEVVLLRKAVLRKVVTNGWADVVISDDVLYNKTSSSPAGSTNGRLLRDAVSSTNFTLQAVTRAVPLDSSSTSTRIGVNQVNPTRTLIKPTGGVQDAITLDIKAVGAAAVSITRVDSDLLPEGVIGTIEVARGDLAVETRLAENASAHDAIVLTPTRDSASVAKTSVVVSIAPTVTVSKTSTVLTTTQSVQFTNPYAPIPSDLTLFVNGSGNLFVLANSSAAVVNSAALRAAGSGFLQVQMDALRGGFGLRASRDFGAMLEKTEALKGAIISADAVCLWSAKTYSASMTGTGTVNASASAATSSIVKVPRCNVTVVPTKVGGSTSFTAGLEPSNGAASSDGGKTSSTTGAATSAASAGLALQGLALFVLLLAVA